MGGLVVAPWPNMHQEGSIKKVGLYVYLRYILLPKGKKNLIQTSPKHSGVENSLISELIHFSFSELYIN